jgi:hypothetical protein
LAPTLMIAFATPAASMSASSFSCEMSCVNSSPARK